MNRRVVITGAGLVTPLGSDINHFQSKLYNSQSGVSLKENWSNDTFSLQTKLVSEVSTFDEKMIPRKFRRCMGRVAMLSVQSTENAILNANLNPTFLEQEMSGVAFGSTMGGMTALELALKNLSIQSTDPIASTTFLQIMPHTCGANIALYFGIKGPLLASNTACASGLQAVGIGYEQIKLGKANLMICGGAEELHPFMIGVFETLKATSRKYNHIPETASRPFDESRDGLVVGEGAATLILEEFQHAKDRGANILAEVIGYHSNLDGNHMTNPSIDGMERVMRGALSTAQITPDKVDYVSAHGTGTPVGDIAESAAIYRIFSENMHVSSLKGHLGHLMGACGAIELISCLQMMHDNRLVHTLNLKNIDSQCAPLNYVIAEPKSHSVNMILKNSFGFGGVNASLLIKKV